MTTDPQSQEAEVREPEANGESHSLAVPSQDSSHDSAVVDEEAPSDDKAEPTTTKSSRATFEIDNGLPGISQSKSNDEDEDDPNDDMRRLLKTASHDAAEEEAVATGPDEKVSTGYGLCSCCGPPQRVGNMKIFLPALYKRTGWGIVGPHWFGPPCVFLIILLASTFFIHHSLSQGRSWTAAVCTLLTIQTCYFLAKASYSNPGIVVAQAASAGPPARGYRWCDLCQAFQPPDGAHCPDCNVCIAGFDHHCVWMGTCIGRKNFKAFVRFNLSWLIYLVYAIVWVSVLGPWLLHGRGELQKATGGKGDIQQKYFGGIDDMVMHMDDGGFQLDDEIVDNGGL